MEEGNFKKSTPSKTLDKKVSLKRKDGKYELPKITDNLACPVCTKISLKLSRTLYNLPDGDDIFIILLECEECNYRKTDMVKMFSAFQPGEYHLTVDDSDFTHKIFRGSTGNIEIDEIGMSIERGPAATFDFTNIEGILLKMKEKLQYFLDSTPIESLEWKNANEAFKRLNNCLAGKMPFKLILKDPDGGSYITPSNEEKLVFIPTSKKN